MDGAILQTERTGGVAVVRVLAKKLYQTELDRFRNELLALVEGGENRLVLDLTSVGVMNSAAIGVVLLVSDRARKSGGKFAVAGLSRLLQELFERMYLNTLFPVTRTADEAVALFKGNKKIPAS